MQPETTLRLAAGLLALGFAAGATAQPADRPNILLIISDDVGVDASTEMYPGLIEDLLEQYGPDGHDHPAAATIDERPASTPVMAELAARGMRFTNAWAHPFCSPTRAAIMTGLFAADTRVANYQDALSLSHDTFVSRLRDDGGYSTAVFGKWHLAGLGTGGGRGARAGGAPAAAADAAPARPYAGMTPKEAGFDKFAGHMGAALGTFWDYQYQRQTAVTPPSEILNGAPPERALPGIAASTYAPIVKVADTIEWIGEREAEDADKPWFVWLAFNLSHATSQRVPAQMAVPQADTLDAESRAEMEACGGVFDSQDTGDCSGEAVMRAMTNSLDTLIGKLLEAVDGIDPNTYIIYVGDNGTPMYGRPGLDFIDNMYITREGRGKGTVYESGARVPLVIAGPGIEGGSVSNAVTHSVDLYSTALSLAGLPIPEQVSNAEASARIPLAGISLAPALFDGAEQVRDFDQGYVLTESHDLMRNGIREVAARNGQYKILCTDSAAFGNCSFYDLIDDPLEEYPLPLPGDCIAYAEQRLTPYDIDWHYCRLTEVVTNQSFL